MNISKKHVKRLASLSALGSGVLAVAAPDAHAAYVIDVVPVHVTVGFSPGSVRSIPLPLNPFSAHFSINAWSLPGVPGVNPC